MKVQSFEQPTIIEPVGNGSYRYRFNLTDIIPEDSERRPYWEYDEVIVWLPITANRILQAVIAEQWDSDYEQKLINEYNSAQLGIYDPANTEEAIQRYTAFLRERIKLKKQVESDCEKIGIQ